MLQERLLDVAIAHFGRKGFEGASTREIARAADTAMSSITYHFGGKEGLYLACADYIAQQIAMRQAHAFEAIGDPSSMGREEAVEVLLAIVDSFAIMMIDDASANWASFIAREQHMPTEAFERLWEGTMRGMLDKACEVFARLRPDVPEKELRATAMLVIGQPLVLRSGRASVLKALRIDKIGEEDGAMLRRVIRTNALAILAAETD